MSQYDSIRQPNRKMLKHGVQNRQIEWSEVRQLIILKKVTPSRMTYGRCPNCKCAAEDKQYFLRNPYGGEKYNSVTFTMLCKCGHKLEWDAIGYAKPDWDPNSSFYRPRDSQRMKSYRWEDEFFAKRAEGVCGTREEATALMNRIFDELGVEAPILQFSDKGRSCLAFGAERIKLTGNFGLKPYIVVHECAHILAIHLIRGGAFPTEPGHGPVWVGMYLHLLERFLGVDGLELIQSARNSIQSESTIRIERALEGLRLAKILEAGGKKVKKIS